VVAMLRSAAYRLVVPVAARHNSDDGGPIRRRASGDERDVAELIVVRHGETEWSRDRRHTGRTDIPLTARGEEQARRLASMFDERSVTAVLTSPAGRARRTAALAGLTGARPDPNLWEWDYGGYEGITTRQIHGDRPGWYLWQDGVVPGDAEHPGETLEEVGARADAVLDRVGHMSGRDGDVITVGHGHSLRVLVARWLGLEPAAGRFFALDAGACTFLGTEHGRPIIAALNVRPA
jgi:broad specificity phosphatase PhoE